MSVQLTLVGKPGCHLCDDARAIVEAVASDPDVSATLTEVSILEDPALADRYAEEIPVVLIDGAMHSYWTVDEARLRRAIATKAEER